MPDLRRMTDDEKLDHYRSELLIGINFGSTWKFKSTMIKKIQRLLWKKMNADEKAELEARRDRWMPESEHTSSLLGLADVLPKEWIDSVFEKKREEHV